MKKDYYFVSQVLAQPKEVKIEIPEGYEIDKEKSTFEKIVFKKKEDTKPRSWEEYCKQNYGKPQYYFAHVGIGVGMSIIAVETNQRIYKDYFPSEELAFSFRAMMQLMSLRQAWIGDWEPNWSSFGEDKWCVMNNAGKFTVGVYGNISRSLSFPTEEMANDFINCFKDLLEIARPLV